MDEQFHVQELSEKNIEQVVNVDLLFPTLLGNYRLLIKECAFSDELLDLGHFSPVPGKRYFLIEFNRRPEALFAVSGTVSQAACISFSRILNHSSCRLVDPSANKWKIDWPSGIAYGWQYLENICKKLFEERFTLVTAKAICGGGRSAFKSFKYRCREKYKIHTSSNGSSLMVHRNDSPCRDFCTKF